MTLFEFLMVLVSIIVGLGIAEILTGVAQQLRCRKTSSGYWLHSCGVVLVFLALLQTWWELWDLHDVQEWHFYDLVLMLVSPASLYLISHLIFPEPVRSSDFREYYYGAMRPIWWLALVATVSSTLFNPIAFGSDFVNWDNASSLVLFFGFIVLGSTRTPAVHSFLVPTFLALLIWDIVRWHPSFSA